MLLSVPSQCRILCIFVRKGNLLSGRFKNPEGLSWIESTDNWNSKPIFWNPLTFRAHYYFGDLHAELWLKNYGSSEICYHVCNECDIKWPEVPAYKCKQTDNMINCYQLSPKQLLGNEFILMTLFNCPVLFIVSNIYF